MKLVSSGKEVIDNIASLQHALQTSDELVDRLAFVHAFYVDDRDKDDLKFGFSKWVGYHDLDADTYLADYKSLNGRSTEAALAEFFEELSPSSPAYRKYHEVLVNWLDGFGKRPRKSVRLMVLRPDHAIEAPAGEDRRLLDLLLAVADLLPVEQRHELRAKL